MRTIAWILKLYPRRWRERYQAEMLAVLEQHTISPATIFDLLLGALDAQLDPAYRRPQGVLSRWLRDPQRLSLAFICGLTLSIFSTHFWVISRRSLIFDGNPISVVAASLVAVGLISLSALCLLALLIITSHGRWQCGMKRTALLCSIRRSTWH